MTPGSVKDQGGFRIGSAAKAAAVYLVESAIDAISLAKLRGHRWRKGLRDHLNRRHDARAAQLVRRPRR